MFYSLAKDGDWCIVYCQVADDGYGVSYIIAGEDTIFYHITCKVSSQLTVSNFILCRFMSLVLYAYSQLANQKRILVQWMPDGNHTVGDWARASWLTGLLCNNVFVQSLEKQRHVMLWTGRCGFFCSIPCEFVIKIKLMWYCEILLWNLEASRQYCFWYASVANEARLISPWVDQFRLICRRIVPRKLRLGKNVEQLYIASSSQFLSVDEERIPE